MTIALTITCRTLVYVISEVGILGVITPDDDGRAQTAYMIVEGEHTMVLSSDEPYLIHACTQDPEAEEY